jgi:L,D-peptidoglycan transpeptidase YkuD (ErfK/YbiS/YcfS/YnhG family)
MAHRWRLAAIAGVLLLFVALSLAVSAIASRRNATIQSAADAATSAMREARSADARIWAPQELRAAERALRAALLAQRIQQTRVWPLPDVSRVQAAYSETQEAARGTLSRARERHAAAVGTLGTLLDEADKAVSTSAGLASAVRLDSERRTLLARAQAALTEARVYEREHDLGTAAERARAAIEMAALVRDHAAAVAARYADAATLARWRRWIDETITWSRREGRAAIVVAKEAHRLTLYLRGEPVKTYRADLGFNWLADKARAGDDATPEGRYRVVSRNLNSASAFYKALLLDYPNADDRARFSRARRSGELPLSAGIGGAIEIHGEGGRGVDWTQGCVALTNADMDDLLRHVGVGTAVTIVGSDTYGAIAEFAARHRDGGAGRQP